MRETNEKLWDAAEKGIAEDVKDLLDPTKNEYPANVNSKYFIYLAYGDLAFI